ncbi:phage holin, lambda family [Salinimonas marina]|uniref:Phage holin, lambda family n=1 Tax=Salinimonas marina TaxID=2785918 RepID=A0A7S9E0B1_9ALTE|nr:phage holin, lambda family [Salinimonas marina]QPG06963.1 phage holin, lambda family [Salinimonas marina]
MFDHLKETPPTVISAALAVVISILRVIYDKEETSFVRILLESALCGALAVVAGSGVTALGLDQDWTIFIGGSIGFIGSQSIRAYADLFLKKKANE